MLLLLAGCAALVWRPLPSSSCLRVPVARMQAEDVDFLANAAPPTSTRLSLRLEDRVANVNGKKVAGIATKEETARLAWLNAVRAKFSGAADAVPPAELAKAVSPFPKAQSIPEPATTSARKPVASPPAPAALPAQTPAAPTPPPEVAKRPIAKTSAIVTAPFDAPSEQRDASAAVLRVRIKEFLPLLLFPPLVYLDRWRRNVREAEAAAEAAVANASLLAQKAAEKAAEAAEAEAEAAEAAEQAKALEQKALEQKTLAWSSVTKASAPAAIEKGTTVAAAAQAAAEVGGNVTAATMIEEKTEAKAAEEESVAEEAAAKVEAGAAEEAARAAAAAAKQASPGSHLVGPPATLRVALPFPPPTHHG